jgi:hypothetical protein
MRFRHVLSLLALATAIAVRIFNAPCRADLFVLTTGPEPLHRVDTATLGIVESYLDPFGFPVSAAFSGLAFDGRILSWTVDLFGMAELHQFDAFSRIPLTPTPLFDVSPTDPIAGLGALGPGVPGVFGPLYGVSRSRIIQPSFNPATIYRIGPFAPLQLLGQLPPEYIAGSMDVDLATGEIWIGARNTALQRAELLSISVADPFQAPAVLQGDDEFSAAAAAAPAVIINSVLTPPVPPIAMRGLGFDEGRMFIVTGARTLNEIDRTTGEILRSVELPNIGVIAGLAGGTLVPEPATFSSMAITLVAAVVRRRPK